MVSLTLYYHRLVIIQPQKAMMLVDLTHRFNDWRVATSFALIIICRILPGIGEDLLSTAKRIY